VEITLIRHAEPEWVRDGLNVDNPPLTMRGHDQAKRLADWLRGEHFDEVLVSPLRRTRQTAEPILEALGHDLVFEPRLEEIRNPIWHGTPVERAEAAYRAEREKTSVERWSGLDGGENVGDFVQRINLGCKLFLEERGMTPIDGDLPVWTTGPKNHRVALIAHAGTNSVVICHLLGLAATPWEWERFVLGHASISRVVSMDMKDGSSFGVSRLSTLEHLPADMRTY
jgi:probable phosphoglycerate mutase